MREDEASVARVIRLQTQLEAAVAASDWKRVAGCDRAIATLLAGSRDGSAEFRFALAGLRRSHERALAAARAECERLEEQLGHLTANREALLAYAQALSEDT